MADAKIELVPLTVKLSEALDSGGGQASDIGNG
jgi:hypothetical protein